MKKELHNYQCSRQHCLSRNIFQWEMSRIETLRWWRTHCASIRQIILIDRRSSRKVFSSFLVSMKDTQREIYLPISVKIDSNEWISIVLQRRARRTKGGEERNLSFMSCRGKVDIDFFEKRSSSKFDWRKKTRNERVSLPNRTIPVLLMFFYFSLLDESRDFDNDEKSATKVKRATKIEKWKINKRTSIHCFHKRMSSIISWAKFDWLTLVRGK